MSYKGENDFNLLIQEAFREKVFERSPQSYNRILQSVKFSSLNPWAKQAVIDSINPCLENEPEKELPKVIQIGDIVTMGGNELIITEELLPTIRRMLAGELLS